MKRILFLGDFAYSSTKPIVSGVIRFLSGHPEVALLIHGAHPGDDDPAYGLDPDVDGVITCIGTYKRYVKKLAADKSRPFAFVCAPCDMPSVRRRAVSLVCDDEAIAETAAALLVRHGLTEFGYVGSRLDSSRAEWDAARREAFLRTLAAKGFTAHVYEPPKRKDGSKAEFAALATWLRGLPKPCGLFVSYDQRAMRVLNLCRAEGIAVPEQIQIVSADNEAWICESTSPTLTSIEPDFEGAGYRAAEALLAMMGKVLTGKAAVPAAETQQPAAKMTASQPAAKMAAFPGSATATFGVRRIVERMSTTDAHGSMSRAVRARNFIQSHVGEPLTVSRVAEQLNCSLRTLQSSYKAVFGTTVWDDIAETRFAMAQELLSSTDIPIGDIPERVGFKSPRHFARLFKTRTGMSMRQWRKSRGT